MLNRLLLAILALILLIGCQDQNEESDTIENASSGTISTNSTQHPSTATSVSGPESQEGETTTSAEPESNSALTVGTPATSNTALEKDVPTGPAPTEITISIESDFDSDGDGRYTVEEFEQAIRHLYPTYIWPERYHPTVEMIIDNLNLEANPGSHHQVPGEYTVIGFAHQCAWEMNWLDAYRDGDTEEMNESLNQLQNVTLENPMFVYIRTDLEESYERAGLGDPAPIQQNVDTNCQYWRSSLTTPQAWSGRERFASKNASVQSAGNVNDDFFWN